MAKSLDDKLKTLSKERRARIRSRARSLIAEETSLRDLRKALALTQEEVAKKLAISQDNVSRLEARSDVLISTLRAYLRAVGGNLRLVVEFPDRPPVSLSGLAAVSDDGANSHRRKR